MNIKERSLEYFKCCKTKRKTDKDFRKIHEIVWKSGKI